MAALRAAAVAACNAFKPQHSMVTPFLALSHGTPAWGWANVLAFVQICVGFVFVNNVVMVMYASITVHCTFCIVFATARQAHKAWQFMHANLNVPVICTLVIAAGVCISNAGSVAEPGYLPVWSTGVDDLVYNSK